MMWSETRGHELYVFKDGELVYKRWNTKSGNKSQPSLLYNTNGWPNEQII